MAASFKRELQSISDVYRSQYKQHGYSPKSLGWDKGKQELRFEILTSQYDFTEKSILDIGCGFGDLNRALAGYGKYTYSGIDIVDEFIGEAQKRYNQNGICFECCDFLEKEFTDTFDYAISSGIFNMKLKNVSNYEYVEAIMTKTYNLTADGFAFDFLSDKVDYKLKHTFHYSPSRILDIVYKYSRNIVLRNDYMPFEFAIFVFKNDSFEKHDTVFNRFKLRRSKR